MVNSLNIYDNDYQINLVSSLADVFLELLELDYKVINNYTMDVNNYIKTNKLPEWIIPISNNYTRLYVDKSQMDSDELYEINDGYIKTTFKEEYSNIHKTINGEDINNYYKYVDVLNNIKYSPTQVIDKSVGYISNNEKKYLLNCIYDSECTSINGKYTIDFRNSKKKMFFNKSY